MTVFQFEPSV